MHAMHWSLLFFFFNDTATTEIYTLSLHDALPICRRKQAGPKRPPRVFGCDCVTLRSSDHAPQTTGRHCHRFNPLGDRKSTRLNSSHTVISYAVFCLKKKNQPTTTPRL